MRVRQGRASAGFVLKVHACYKTTACGVSLAQLSVSFDRFELHPAARLLLADGQPVALGGRAFDLLCALVEGRDRVVTKSELLDLAWPGLVVEENNLTVQISALRKVLGKDAISTVAGRGYRFTLTVAPSTVHSKLGPIWEAGGPNPPPDGLAGAEAMAELESIRRLGGYARGAGLEFIPFLSFRIMGETWRVSSTEVEPSYRLRELGQAKTLENPLWVGLRESNVFSSSLYRWHGGDPAFVFFTDDLLLARPLAGGFNVAAGLAQSLSGLLTLPWDGGKNLRLGVKGALISLPELFFFNIRKGSFPGLP